MAEGRQELARIKKGAGKDLQGVKEAPDPETQVETRTAERDKARIDRDKARAEVAGLRQNIKERKKYASLIFRLICGWVAAVFLLLILQGFGARVKFSLPEPVILAFIGGTSLNVLGLFYIVAHYLFPNPGVGGTRRIKKNR